jgi:transposase, IS30 family
MTVRFSNQLVAELYQPFWAAWQAGEFLTDAGAVHVSSVRTRR